MIRLRNYHREEWERVCGKNPFFVSHRLLRYTWGKEWQAVADPGVTAAARLSRLGDALVVSSSLCIFVFFIVFSIWKWLNGAA